MNNIIFSPGAWDEYISWQTQDKKTLKRINGLLKDVARDAFRGAGKPEPLRYQSGWSRRIDETNRLVYEIRDGDIVVLSCMGHYED